MKRSGYNVLEAQHAAEEVPIVLQHPRPIHLLLTDLVMPFMGGCDVAKRLPGRKDIKGLYMSGHDCDSAFVRVNWNRAPISLRTIQSAEFAMRLTSDGLQPRSFSQDTTNSQVHC